MPDPKILFFDLETSGVNGLQADLATTLCFGYKWLGEEKTHVLTVDQFPNWFSYNKGINDKPLLQAALQIMERTDLLVAHYGERFDRKFFQGRCAIHGLTPPPPTKLRDTWRIARTAFKFSSNRLGKLSEILKLKQRKHIHKKANEWPGWWLRAMSGDHNAIAAMAKYCAQDIRTLEALYLRIRQYDYPHPRVFMNREKCGVCGGNIYYRGFAFVGVNRYRRFQCSKCGKWGRETKKV